MVTNYGKFSDIRMSRTGEVWEVGSKTQQCHFNTMADQATGKNE
jgi:hypothetical protein